MNLQHSLRLHYHWSIPRVWICGWTDSGWVFINKREWMYKGQVFLEVSKFLFMITSMWLSYHLLSVKIFTLRKQWLNLDISLPIMIFYDRKFGPYHCDPVETFIIWINLGDTNNWKWTSTKTHVLYGTYGVYRIIYYRTHSLSVM